MEEGERAVVTKLGHFLKPLGTTRGMRMGKIAKLMVPCLLVLQGTTAGAPLATEGVIRLDADGEIHEIKVSEADEAIRVTCGVEDVVVDKVCSCIPKLLLHSGSWSYLSSVTHFQSGRVTGSPALPFPSMSACQEILAEMTSCTAKNDGK